MNQSILKQDGMIQAASADRFHLERARRAAKRIGQDQGFCTVDDVRLALPDLPSGNYMGSIFREDCWGFHSYRKAEHANSHARVITVWKYVGGNSDGKSPAASNLHLRDAAPASSFKNQGELFEGVHSNKFRTEIGF